MGWEGRDCGGTIAILSGSFLTEGKLLSFDREAARKRGNCEVYERPGSGVRWRGRGMERTPPTDVGLEMIRRSGPCLSRAIISWIIPRVPAP